MSLNSINVEDVEENDQEEEDYGDEFADLSNNSDISSGDSSIDYDDNIQEPEENEAQPGLQGNNENENHNPIENNDLFRDEPLYTGAPLTMGQSMLMILTLFMKHNLTQTCLADIIDCINLHCIADNLQRNSLYKFKTYFDFNLEETFRKHYYCSICLKYLESANDRCVTCTAKTEASYFVELPFLNQLEEMYKRDGFYDSLQHRFFRQVPPDTVDEVYDGNIYKQRAEPGDFLASTSNISLGWYSDGVPVFKSSKVSMWPLYLTINELPFELRMKRENILLAGIWFGPKKPAANYFLREFLEIFATFFNNGYQMYCPGRRDAINVKGLLLFGACDLPAKAEFLNLVQFNGKYGCPNCLNPGETFFFQRDGDPENNQRLGHTHVYPYNRNFVLRTTAESIAQGLAALAAGSPNMGIKGPCALANIMPNYITATGIYRMHGVDGGIIKKLIKLWFTTEYSKEPFSLTRPKNLVGLFDDYLQNIKPPK